MLDLGLCPYMGLKAFGEEDTQFFFGRESLTPRLINQLNQQAFLAVVGASGSGKSSLLHAGAIAQLRQGSSYREVKLGGFAVCVQVPVRLRH